MSIDDYTERQQAILRGEVPLDELDARAFMWIKKRAIQLGDTETEARVREMQERVRKQDVRKPSALGYTVRQQAILRSEVPLDQLDGRAFTNLINRAAKLGDTETEARARELLNQARKRPPKSPSNDGYTDLQRASSAANYHSRM